MESGYNVLVAEDEAPWQEILAEILADEGCRVQIADSYYAAWELLTAHEVDLLVLDLDLEQDSPVFAGTRLLSHLRHIDTDVPCIIVSGKGTIPIVRQAFKEFAVWDFFEKEGFDIRDFQRSVRSVLSGRPRRRIKYLDLEVEFHPRRGDAYQVTVRSPVGARSADVTAPALVESTGPVPTEAEAKDLGARLFDALFGAGSPVGELYYRTQERLDEGTALRVKIGADLLACPDLAPVSSLPWEYLYDSKHRHFLSLHARCTVVRYVPTVSTRPRSAMRLPLNLLVVSACPQDLPSLEVEEEKRRIREAVHSGLGVEFADHITQERLYELLDSLRVHVIHYIGHGNWEGERGVLYLEDARGLADSIDGEKLGHLILGARRADVRLVVLSACKTAVGPRAPAMLHSVAVQMIACGVPSVIAMQFPISERVAVEFTRHFYLLWPGGGSVDEAVSAARRHIYAQESETAEWGAPVLFVSQESW